MRTALTLDLFAVLLGVLLWPSIGTGQIAASANDRIEARRIADEIMRATQRADVRGVVRYFTHDVQLQVDNKHMDGRTYEERMRTLFPSMSDYRYVRTNEAVTAGPRGDILMSFRLEEHFNLRGKRYVSTSQQTYHMRREGGELKIYRVVAR